MFTALSQIFLLPFVIAGVIILHIWALHIPGSSNPTGVEVKGPQDTVPFHPYYTAKDGFSPLDFTTEGLKPLLKDAMGAAAPTLMTHTAAARASRKLRKRGGYGDPDDVRNENRKRAERADRKEDALGTPMYIMLATDVDPEAFEALIGGDGKDRDPEAEARLRAGKG